MFNKFLKEEYQFILKQVVFRTIDEDNDAEQFKINISDDISVAFVDGGLFVDYCRNVYFEPNGIFDIKVNFGLKLSFKDGVKSEEVCDVDWVAELGDKENPYMANIIARTSNIISNLTSSFGQQPLITPPVFVKE